VSPSEPVPLGDALAAVTADLRSATPDVLAGLARQWVEVVGPEIADHATPGSLVDGVLTINVDEPAAATSLRQAAPQLAERLATVVGSGAVRQIRVLVSRPRRSSRD
jgi:predicted nucleic acid-binding Zn ribbon protein